MTGRAAWRTSRLLAAVVATAIAATVAAPSSLFAQTPPKPDTAKPDAAKPAALKPVSFYKEVRPFLTASCAGCHQPAKAGGHVVLTSYAAILTAPMTPPDPKGAKDPLVAPGQPDESRLLAVLLPRGEKPPKMPKSGGPLTEKQIDLVRRWIAEGGTDDTPAAASETFSMERPPVYTQPPVVTSLDFAPDGCTLAVSGYHETLLFNVELSTSGGAGNGVAANTAGVSIALSARLVGLSERIQTAAFSPDGARLLVVGGSPARLGEVQIWNVKERKLELSQTVGADTLYGGSWSPDGKLVAFGGGDSSVRILDREKGELVFFNAASEDLVQGTRFSSDASHVVSIGRDRALKLFQVATQQFIDNITSITPGALKGGLLALDRHPKEDVLLIGGADGQPKTYKMYRTQKREIGDDFNHLKSYAPLAGRLFAAEYAPDGARFVVGSSNDGKGEVRVYAADQEAPVWSLPTATAIYATTFRGDGALIAAAGFDGTVLLIDAASGALLGSFQAVPLRS